MAARKKASEKKKSAGNPPRKKASGAKTSGAKTDEPRASTKKSRPDVGDRRPFSLTTKQATTLQAKLAERIATRENLGVSFPVDLEDDAEETISIASVAAQTVKCLEAPRWNRGYVASTVLSPVWAAARSRPAPVAMSPRRTW